MSGDSCRFVAIAGTVALTVFVTAGCGRRVVIEPDEVHRHNTEWIPRRPAPAPATTPVPLPAPLPAADAGTPTPTI